MIKIIHKFIGVGLGILNIFHKFVSTKRVKDMANKRRYQVGRSACGWGIWEVATGNKVASFGRNRS